MGWKAVEEFCIGDEVLSRDEHDPNGPVVAKVVEDVFTRHAIILHLHLVDRSGEPTRLIRTTSEHPFYRHGDGWVSAGELREGDWLWTLEGRWVRVEEVYDTGELETVYNLRIADYHTYFVGDVDWSYNIWAHNAEYPQGKGEGRLPPKGTPERKAIEKARKEGIKKKQDEELANIRAGGKGSGVWTDEELEQIRKTGKFPADAYWHHDPTVANQPDRAGDPSVIRPGRGGILGHLFEHGGDWRKPLPGLP
jgi:hypothetical protein